jgi:hypothetical protein
VFAAVLIAEAVFVRNLDGEDATVEAGEALDEQSAAPEQLSEIYTVGETVGIDVTKNKHRDTPAISAVQNDGTYKIAAKELSPIDFENWAL